MFLNRPGSSVLIEYDCQVLNVIIPYTSLRIENNKKCPEDTYAPLLQNSHILTNETEDIFWWMKVVNFCRHGSLLTIFDFKNILILKVLLFDQNHVFDYERGCR